LCYYPAMTTVLLVRHGQNDWVKKNRLAGWIPGVHLNEEGQKQAAAAAERLAHLPVKAIYSSPVERCMETAQIIAGRFNQPVIALADVGEVRYGEWEGEEIKILAKKKAWYAVQHFPSRFQFPEGEALWAVQQRAVMALEKLSHDHPEELIVVVSHADVIKLVLAHYLGVHIDLFQRIGLSPASVSALSLHKSGMVHVLRINDDGPFQPPPPPKKDEDESESTSHQESEKVSGHASKH